VDAERLAAKVSESIEILERLRSISDTVSPIGSEIIAELVEIHGHALALKRMAGA